MILEKHTLDRKINRMEKNVMKKKLIYALMTAAVFCMAVGCGKKAEKNVTTESAAVQTEAAKETTAPAEDASEKATEPSTKEETANSEKAAVSDNSAKDEAEVTDSQEEQAEQIETAADDSWENSAEGWD